MDNDPAQTQQQAQEAARAPGGYVPNGAAPGPGEREAPPAEQVPTTADVQDAIRMAATCNREVGGMVSRLDQLETRVARIDRQVLMVVGMIAVVMFGVKQLAGKLEELGVDAPVPPTS